MKKILLTLALLVSVLLLNHAYAQKVGYEGKRFLFNVDTKIDLEFEDLDFFELNVLPKFFFSYSPNIEFILLKNVSIGLAATYFSDKISVYYSSQDYNLLPFTVVGAGIFYKQYLNRNDDFYQAPFGVYFNFRFDYLKYYLEFPTYVYDNFVLGTRVELGVDYLVWDRVRLSWGLSFGISSSFVNQFISFQNSNYVSQLTPRLNEETIRRYGFQHKFGIGILLF